MKKFWQLGMVLFLTIGLTACGKEEVQQVEYVEIAPQETSEPVVLIPEDLEDEQEEETSTIQEEEIVSYVDLQTVEYELEDKQYEEGVVQIKYPVIKGMQNDDLQQTINENIEKVIKLLPQVKGLSAYKVEYEIASKGSGILSLVFRGYYNGTNQAYPVNFVKTLNIDMTTGKNLRLKDFADIATVVSYLEQDYGYEMVSDSTTKEEFSSFLNYGYMTDYAIMLLDFDIDFSNLSLTPTGYSCIKDNHLVMFFETEHAMGDYAEIQFSDTLTK